MERVISVVLPVYNKEPHVARSICSVLNQSFENFELIIVCDPSTDKSNEVVESFSDERIRLFYRDQPGPGGYAARNLGIRESCCEWVAFIDADDEWYADHLEKIVKSIHLNPQVSFFTAGYVEVQGGVETTNYFYRKHYLKPVNFTFKEYLSCSPFYTSVVCTKKKLLVDSGMFPEGLMNRGGDVDTWLRVIELSGGYMWSNHLGAKYHKDSVNMVTRVHPYTETEVRFISLLKMIDKYSGSMEIELKRKFNNTLTYAWNQNIHMGVSENVKLKGRLFVAVQPLRACLFILASMLPFPMINPIHKVAYFLVKMKRKINR